VVLCDWCPSGNPGFGLVHIDVKFSLGHAQEIALDLCKFHHRELVRRLKIQETKATTGLPGREPSLVKSEAVETALLRILAKNRAGKLISGGTLKQRLSLGTEGQRYTALVRLRDRRWIKRTGKGPRDHSYMILPAGRAALRKETPRTKTPKSSAPHAQPSPKYRPARAEVRNAIITTLGMQPPSIWLSGPALIEKTKTEKYAFQNAVRALRVDELVVMRGVKRSARYQLSAKGRIDAKKNGAPKPTQAPTLHRMNGAKATPRAATTKAAASRPASPAAEHPAPADSA
jgi:DNA-binding PadR family transcriptional regulator